MDLSIRIDHRRESAAARCEGAVYSVLEILDGSVDFDRKNIDGGRDDVLLVCKFEVLSKSLNRFPGGCDWSLEQRHDDGAVGLDGDFGLSDAAIRNGIKTDFVADHQFVFLHRFLTIRHVGESDFVIDANPILEQGRQSNRADVLAMPQGFEVDGPRVAPTLFSVRILCAVDAGDTWFAGAGSYTGGLLRRAHLHGSRNATAASARTTTDCCATATILRCYALVSVLSRSRGEPCIHQLSLCGADEAVAC